MNLFYGEIACMHQTLIYFPALLKMKAFTYAKKKWKTGEVGYVALLGVLISGDSLVHCLLLR